MASGEGSMSTVADPKVKPASLPQEDPYRYGFRDEYIVQADGTSKFVQTPLTPEDFLHPHEGDHFVEGSMHDLLRGYLRDVFRVRVQNNPAALVLSNTGIYWDDPKLEHHAPDVAVIFGIARPRPHWPSFHIAKEGTRPSLMVELVSPLYRKADVVDKFKEYHQARVPHYVIFDRQHDDDPWTIKAYLRNPQRYVPQPLEDDGRYWLEELNLWLAVDGQNIRCFDGDTNEEIGDYAAVTRRVQQMRDLANAESVRAEAEKARADAAEARYREVEAEIARLKGQPPAP
jgi:colicin import membrane protein